MKTKLQEQVMLFAKNKRADDEHKDSIVNNLSSTGNDWVGDTSAEELVRGLK